MSGRERERHTEAHRAAAARRKHVTLDLTPLEALTVQRALGEALKANWNAGVAAGALHRARVKVSRALR